MSSSTYSAELRPDAGLRRLVVLSGMFFGALGVALLLTLPLHAAASVACSGSWLLLCVRELVKIRRGYALCCGLRMTAGGEISVLGPDGAWRVAQLSPGSVLLRRLGWIRLTDRHGRRCAELIRGSCRESDDWRRLQVIWQHIGATTRSC
ncbi:MAG: hypothetical protein ACR2QI_08395 [Woeseiaceae bacterium]